MKKVERHGCKRAKTAAQGFAWAGRTSISRSVFPDHKQGDSTVLEYSEHQRTALPSELPQFRSNFPECGGVRGKEKKCPLQSQPNGRLFLNPGLLERAHKQFDSRETRLTKLSHYGAFRGKKTVRNKLTLSWNTNKLLFSFAWIMSVNTAGQTLCEASDLFP